MRASEFTFNSCTAKNKIFTRLYEPDTPPVAVLQIAHGMAEHSALYKPFCEYMAQRGMVVAVNDHLGHGRSVASGALYGHFGDRGGLYNVVEDVRNLQSILREKYPDLPYFLMGHSMGSFVAREFAAAYGASLTAAVFMGTSAGIPEGVWRAERAYLEMLKKSKGPRAKLPYLAQIVTGPYNRKFKPNRTDFDWVTSKEEEVDRFVNDPLCGFPLTVQGYIDLGALLHAVNTDEWYRRLPKKLPVYLISGENDPVGGMGKGVRKIEKKLRETGHDVTMTLYPHVRHALVTEVNADRVFEDVYAFLAAHLPKRSRPARFGQNQALTIHGRLHRNDGGPPLRPDRGRVVHRHRDAFCNGCFRFGQAQAFSLRGRLRRNDGGSALRPDRGRVVHRHRDAFCDSRSRFAQNQIGARGGVCDIRRRGLWDGDRVCRNGNLSGVCSRRAGGRQHKRRQRAQGCLKPFFHGMTAFPCFMYTVYHARAGV